jgi:hypothetical protein
MNVLKCELSVVFDWTTLVYTDGEKYDHEGVGRFIGMCSMHTCRVLCSWGGGGELQN